jgi:tRNA modification GTPase
MVNKIRNEISNHLNDNKIGQKIKDGLNLVILGSPNVGKSSLINFLAQSEIAIVSDIAGTTRDVIEVHLEIKGIAVKISDTAGLRISDDPIEKEGIKRALQKANFADIKILVIDAQNPIFNQDLIDEKTIIVVNKIDKINDFNLESFCKKYNFSHQINNIVTISLINNINTLSLFNILETKIIEILPPHNSALITQERYRKILQNCLNNLENFSLKKNIELCAHDLWFACQELGRITGKVDIENILDIIFSRFCIGK